MFYIILHTIITIITGLFIVPFFERNVMTKENGVIHINVFRNKTQAIRIYAITALLFSAISTYIYVNVRDISSHTQLQILLIMLCTYVSIAPLLYLAVTDFNTMKVPRILLLIYTGILTLGNIALLLLHGVDSTYFLWEYHLFVPHQNLISGSILAIGIALIVLITKGKGMGKADIAIAASIGLLNGYTGSILAVYIAVFSALFYGLVVSVPTGTIKNVRIPFIPFLVLGAISAFLLPDDFLLRIMTHIS